MKIEKYTKLKGNKYSVKIDDLTIKLYDDVIIKYELLRIKEIDDKLFEEITTYNDKLEAYYKCLKYITKKLRTEKEIVKYLSKSYDKSTIDETVEKLKKYGYLDRNVYLKCYLSDQINLSLVGPNKIKKDLITLGYNEEEIIPFIEEIANEIWISKIEKIVKKRINSNRNLSNSRLKEKICYDLGNLGFYKWMIEEVLDSCEFNDNSKVLEKEYNKYYIKLAKKYDGSNLDYQVKMKLLQKGFNSNEISEFIQLKKNS